MAAKKSPVERLSTVKQSADEIADAVMKLSAVSEAMESSKLKKRAIILLLQDLTGVPRTTIEVVLASLGDLKTFIK